MCQMQCCSNYNKTTLQLNNNWNVASDISQNRQAAKSIFSMDISDYAASFIGIQRHQNHVYWLRPPEPNSLNLMPPDFMALYKCCYYYYHYYMQPETSSTYTLSTSTHSYNNWMKCSTRTSLFPCFRRPPVQWSVRWTDRRPGHHLGVRRLLNLLPENAKHNSTVRTRNLSPWKSH